MSPGDRTVHGKSIAGAEISREGDAMTIADFLLARIAEDEAWADRSSRHNDTDAFAKDNYGCLLVDPARVLAECEAKRRIVSTHAVVTEDHTGAWWALGNPGSEPVRTGCDNCRKAGVDGEDYLVNGPCDTLRALAAVYADHPDYDEAWRP